MSWVERWNIRLASADKAFEQYILVLNMKEDLEPDLVYHYYLPHNLYDPARPLIKPNKGR